MTTVLDARTNSGIANVTVEIRHTETGPLVTTSTTNSSGVSDVAVSGGSYWIHVVPPAGYSFAEGRAEFNGAQISVGSSGSAAVTVRLTKM